MREIDAGADDLGLLPKHTFLTYGSTRSGKTTWSAGFPRPLFLSDVTEAGWESIKNMPDEAFFEPGVRPKVWGIEQMNDMATAVAKAEPLIASGEIQTVVVDSLSFYVDLYLNYVIMAQARKDARAAYGDLGNHLRDLRVKIHRLPVNVIWLCLEKTPDTDNPIGGPMIPGQQADKFMAGVNFIFHSTVTAEKDPETKQTLMQFAMRTRKHGPYIAGGRLGANEHLLPDPLIGTYSDMLSDLGYDIEAAKQSLPPLATKAKSAPNQATNQKR